MATVRGGDKFNLALVEIARSLSSGGAVRIGFLENATYPITGMSVAAVAFFQEYGTRSIPPRPFFRNMVAAKSGEWPAAIAGLVRTTGYNTQRVLELTGEAIKDQLKESIINTNSPPLARSTLIKRGVDPNTRYDPTDASTFGAKPLIDTAHMYNSVDFEVTLA